MVRQKRKVILSSNMKESKIIIFLSKESSVDCSLNFVIALSPEMGTLFQYIYCFSEV